MCMYKKAFLKAAGTNEMKLEIMDVKSKPF